MATVKLVILPNKIRKNGTVNVKVAVAQRGETAYINTDYDVKPDEFRDGMVVRRKDATILNLKLLGMLDEYKERMRKIDCRDYYTAVQLRDILDKRTDVTIKELADEYCEGLIREGRESYADMIQYAAKTFTKFLDVPVSRITPYVMQDFVRFMENNTRMGESTRNSTLGRIRVLVNIARRNGIEIDPFKNIKIRSSYPRICDLTPETFKYFRDAVIPIRYTSRIRCRDLFMLSFTMGGMNLKDLCKVDFSKDVVTYTRSKSERRFRNRTVVRFTIPDEARKWAKPYLGENGLLEFDYEKVKKYTAHVMPMLKRQLGIDEELCFYSARKTFAQFACEIGIERGVISHILGHSDSKDIMSYYVHVTQVQADEAIKKVLDYAQHL